MVEKGEWKAKRSIVTNKGGDKKVVLRQWAVMKTPVTNGRRLQTIHTAANIALKLPTRSPYPSSETSETLQRLSGCPKPECRGS